jgi:DNA-binding MarR family transcriptional regulator
VNIAERFAWVRAVIAAQPRPTPAEVAVAVTLAEHFNADRGAAWPAQQTIADLTRMQRRNVRRALDDLEQRGFISRLTDGGPKSSARVALVLPSDGAVQRHQRAPQSAISGRPTAPSDGATQRPEQVSRSDSVGTPYPAAAARFPYGSRARGGNQSAPSKQRRTAQPVTPLKL